MTAGAAGVAIPASKRQLRAGQTPTTVVLAARTKRHRINFHPNSITRAKAEEEKREARRQRLKLARRAARRNKKSSSRRREGVATVDSKKSLSRVDHTAHGTALMANRRKSSDVLNAQATRLTSAAAARSGTAEVQREVGPEIPPPAPEPTVKMCKFRHVEGCTVCRDLYDHFTLPDGTQVRQPHASVCVMCRGGAGLLRCDHD